jgi:hypothetical protein
MKISSLVLAAACLAAAACSAGNSAASNQSTAQPAPTKTTAANSNVVNTAAANAAPANAQPAQKADSPDAVVKELYKQHDAKNSPFFQTKDRAAVDKYFTKKLADLIWKDAVSSEGEVGALGADPLYDAQDTEITGLKIQADQVDGDQALVLVTFKNFGKAQTLIFNVERENKVWKISNITGNDYNLLENLQAAAKG